MIDALTLHQVKLGKEDMGEGEQSGENPITQNQRTEAAVVVLKELRDNHGPELLEDEQVKHFIQVAFGGAAADKEAVRKIMAKGLGHQIDEARVTGEMKPVTITQEIPLQERRSINAFFAFLALEKQAVMSGKKKEVDLNGIVENLKAGGLYMALPERIKSDIEEGKGKRGDRPDLTFKAHPQPSDEV